MDAGKGHATRARSTLRGAVRSTALAAALLALCVAGPAGAALTPRDVAGIGFAVVPGTALPGDAAFRDEHGTAVRLRDYVGARPLLVVPGWFGCSNLCSLVLAGLAHGLAQARLVAGRDVEVVVVGIAPLETPAMAAARKRAVLGDGAARGWHFLTGPVASIDAVTAALNFHAAYDAQAASYAHATGVAFADRQGVLRTMLPGIAFEPAALRAALTRAAAPAHAVRRDARSAPSALPAATPAAPNAPTRWLLCLHDDLASGRYNAAALAGARALGLASLAGLAALMLRGGRRGKRSGGRA
jgi:protein SCO1/2